MPGETAAAPVPRSEFDAWFEAATQKYGLQPSRYVREGGVVRDTTSKTPKAYGGLMGDALLARHEAALARARAAASDPSVSWSPAWREMAVERVADELSDPDAPDAAAPTLQRDTMRLKDPVQAPLPVPPEPLRAGAEGRLSDAYMAYLRGVKSPSGRILATPARFAEALASDKRMTRRDRRKIARWLAQYEAHDRSTHPGRYELSPGDTERLQLEAHRDELQPGSPEHQEVSARLAAMHENSIKADTWKEMSWLERAGTQTATALDAALGGYIPKLPDAVAWAADKAAGADGTKRSLGGMLEDLRGGIIPEGKTGFSKTLGSGAGMIASPINRLVPGAQAASRLGQAAHSGLGFAALTAADRGADMAVGRWTGADWKTLQERLDAEAEKYAESTGAKDDAAKEAARKRFMAGQGDQVWAAAKDTFSAGLTGAAVGFMRPLKESFMAAIGRRMANSSPQKVAILRSLAGGQFDNFLLSALPQITADGVHSPIVATAMFGHGEEREQAIEAIIAGALASTLGTRPHPDQGVTGRDVESRLVGEGRVDPDSFEAVWSRVSQRDRQLIAAQALQGAKTQGEFIRGITDVLEPQMKQVKATTDAIRQAQADVSEGGDPGDFRHPTTAAGASEPSWAPGPEVITRFVGEPRVERHDEVSAVDSETGERVYGRYLGDFRMSPDATSTESFLEVTDGDGRKRNVLVEKPSIETIVGGEPDPVDVSYGDARLEASRKSAEAAAARVGAPAVVEPAAPANPRVREVSNPEEFFAALKRNAEESGHGAFVSVPDSADFYAKHKMLMGEHGETAAVSPDGDIVAVSKPKSAPPGWVDAVIPEAVARGGNRMDNFDRPAGAKAGLPDFYSKHGFRAVARTPFNREYAPKGWDYAKHGEPDVVFMARDSKAGPYKPGDGVRVGSYDEGVAAQRGALSPAEEAPKARDGEPLPEPAVVRHLGRDVPAEQARVEREWLDAAAKTEKLETDPQAQAVGILLMEAKMASLGRLRGESPEEQYRRLDIAFKTDSKFRQEMLEGKKGLEVHLDPQRARRAFAPKEELPRGMISFLEDGRSLISILERADVATLGHEMSHFLEHYIPGGHDAVLTIKRFLGLKPDEDMTAADKEAFARLFEVYDHSGQAPTKALESVFNAAAEWMGYVYGKVGKIGLREGAKPREGHKFFDRLYEAAERASAHPDDLAAAIVRDREMDPDALTSTKDQGDDAFRVDVKERLAPGVPQTHEEVMEAAERLRKERKAEDAADAADRDAPDDVVETENLFDAASKGDESATDELAARALQQAQHPPRDPKGRPVDVPEADLDALTAQGRRHKMVKVGDGEVLVTPEGLFNVTRKDGVAHLEPRTETLPRGKGGPTLYSGIPVPAGIGKALAAADQAIGDVAGRWTGKVTDPLLDFVADKIIFNPDFSPTAYLRKNFTELGWDPGVVAVQQRSSGRRAKALMDVVEPAIKAFRALGGGKDAKINEALARHLDAGTTPDGDLGHVVTLWRKGFDELLDRMVDLGMVDRDTGQRFRGRYFPYANVSEPTEKATRKQIRELTKVQRKKGLTAAQERQLAGARERLKELTSAQPTPDHLIKRFGEVSHPVDASDVVGAGARMRRRSSGSLDEAIESFGLDITTNPERDLTRAFLTELNAVEAMTQFRELKQYGVDRDVPGLKGHKLVEPPAGGERRAGYVLVPKTAAGFGGIDTFGELAGHYVHDSVWSQLEVHLHKPGDFGRAYDALHQFLKKGKTTYRLGGHILQWVGNPLIWTMHGVPAAKFAQVYADGRNLAHGHDIGKSFEVRGRQQPITRDFLLNEGVLTGESAADPIEKVHHGDTGTPQSIVEAVLDTAEKMVPGSKMLSKAYGLPDQYSRAGLYVHFREAGLGHEAATEKVRGIYDMTNVPRGVATLARHWSFFRFSYTMLRNVKAMARHTPWALAKAAGFFSLMQAAHRGMLGATQEEYDEALYGAIPGDDFGQAMKRATAMPWINEDGRPGVWTVWNMFPQQTIMQGFTPTPAEERGGGKAEAIIMALAGGNSLVWKPLLEVAMNKDLWSGQRNLLRNRYGETGEGGFAGWSLAAAKHVGKNWAPAILDEGATAMDAAGAFPAGVSTRRPNSSGRFQSTADATAGMLGVNVRRPDEVRARITRSTEALEARDDVFFDNEGHPQPATDLVDPRAVKDARRAIQERDTALVVAAAKRATAWLNEGNVDEAVKEIRTRTRLKEMRKALDEAGRVALDAASARMGILPRLKR